MRVLENLEPKSVFRHFEDISAIPRGSGNEKAVSDFILTFAKSLGLEARQDAANNLVVKKPASPGYESAPTVIIQGHMDMVCEKNNATEFDFLTEGIRLVVDGDYIKADGTTLGADNGIAVAYAMALMEYEGKHPALELLLTADEEVGMLGAKSLDPSWLNGKILINADAEGEGVFLGSCAGGVRVQLTIEGEKANPADEYKPYRVVVSGLKGGHSGAEIHKERGNANKLIARFLEQIGENHGLLIAELNGGSKDNAIPREAEALVYSRADKKTMLAEAVKFQALMQNELRGSDSGAVISVSVSNKKEKAFDAGVTKRIINCLLLLPCGPLAMSQSIEGLVETSNNVGVVTTAGNTLSIKNAIRSSVGSRKEAVRRQISVIAGLCGAKAEESGDYPAWEFDPDSGIRKIFAESWKALSGADARIEAIHAGLECGLFSEKLPGTDMIAFGPDIYDVHTPDEQVSISSTERCWELLLAVLEKII